ncbi:alpha/beta-hydrolase [Piromyces finnis]|uniref:Alpha/beta-hydrolase n=1 Tax=Piromyces finnis TaxID=1754191 RepID=A0A1Y1VJB2_9FUNG|nr:alpha/beta-hydrolase [Piromyces finnis]|eukprot:ORX57269.1 alpha/beta-hydrolase [Piromyces finnis]
MKIFSLTTTLLLVLNFLLYCNASLINFSSIKNFINKGIETITSPIKSFLNEKEDENRDSKNYHNELDIERDIIFNKDRTLDIYYDKIDIITKSKLKPVNIFVFGGSWYSGSKVKFTKFGSLLEKNDYVAVLPNYVLFPQGGFEDMVDDIYNAIQWTHKNIKKYGGDPNRISISAYSAGAHLTALAIFKSLLGYPNKNKILKPLPMLEKVVLLNGPYDFDDYYEINNYFGKESENSIVENLAKVVFRSKNVSPTDLLKPYAMKSLKSLGAKKFVFFYTSLDKQVKESSAQNLIKQMKRICPNVNINYVYKEGYEHTTLTRGIRAGSAEEENVFINLVNL